MRHGVSARGNVPFVQPRKEFRGDVDVDGEQQQRLPRLQMTHRRDAVDAVDAVDDDADDDSDDGDDGGFGVCLCPNYVRIGSASSIKWMDG